MKLLMSIFCILLAVSDAPAQASGGDSGERPNIIYIVADDLGWRDVGFHGATDIKTPNLDRLAAEGARLEQFYAQPFCTPTRAAIMTGRYPMRYGLQTVVIPSKGTYGLAEDERLLPEVLRDAGYHSAMIGKWHLGHADRKYWPRQRGFDYFYGAVLGEIDYFTHSSHGVLDWQRDNTPVKEEGYATRLLGDDAVRLIDAHDGKKPLFLYLAFTAPHSPYQAPPEYVDRFKDIPDETRRTYAGMIACLDDQVGRVVEALDRRNMRASTLIVFHSDNGGTRDARVSGEGTVKSLPCDNGPLKGGKSQLYEGGTRVPAFVNWPGHVKPGEVRSMVHVVDMLPTLAALAGAPTDKCKPLDGRNLWSAIDGRGDSGRDEIVYNIEPFRAALRQGDWKLVWVTLLPGRVELYNLADDAGEATNLADKYPEVVSRFESRIKQLATDAVKPLFFEAASKAVFSGIFGPAPIPMDNDSATAEP